MSEQLLQSAVYLLEQLVSCVYCMILEHPKQTTVYILEQLARCMQVYNSSYGGQLSAFKGDNGDNSDLLL